MPSFSDSIFLFVLALLLFGPKKLPVLAREIGKWVGEFRRASSEFKMQMEDELRLSEQADRNKQIAAMEAAAPIAPPFPEPEHPHLPAETLETATDVPAAEATEADPAMASYLATEASRSIHPEICHPESQAKDLLLANADGKTPAPPAYEVVDGVRKPVPIAVSGELKIMPPSTGLPTARESALKGLLNSIPAASDLNETANEPETTAHGI